MFNGVSDATKVRRDIFGTKWTAITFARTGSCDYFWDFSHMWLMIIWHSHRPER